MAASGSNVASSYQDVRKLIRSRGLLHDVMLELTYECNLDCFYCYNDKKASGRALELEDYIRLFDDLARMEVLFLTFTGGEPMIHPQVFDLGEAARERGFVVRLRTNGHTMTPKTVDRVQRSIDPFLVEISLHGATAATHDRQTRVAGSFDRLMTNLEALKAAGMRTVLVCTPTAWNERELLPMLALADEKGLTLRFQGPVAPRDDGDVEPVTINPSRAAWDELSSELARRAAFGGPEIGFERGCAENRSEPASGTGEDHCGVGKEEVVIDPFGNVLPCLHVRWPSGNLHESSIEEIWRTSPVFQRARDLSARTARRFSGLLPVVQHGAPVFCPGVELKAAGKH